MRLTLPTDSQARKDIPLARGALAYFPAILAGVASVSKAGNDKHNPGQPLHHSRGKSSDHADCVLRHLVDVMDLEAKLPNGGPLMMAEDIERTKRALLNEVNQLAWRALALGQELHEKFGGVPMAPGARPPPPPPLLDYSHELDGPNLGRDGEPR